MHAIGLVVFFARSTCYDIEHLDFGPAELENEVRRRREFDGALLQSQKMEAVGHSTGIAQESGGIKIGRNPL